MILKNTIYAGIFLISILCVVQSQYIPIILLPTNLTFVDGNNGYGSGYGNNNTNTSSGFRPPGLNYNNYYNYDHKNQTNNTNFSSGFIPPVADPKNQYPGYSFNHTVAKNTSVYNGTEDGHLFLGQIQLYDRLLFNQVFRKDKRWWGTREKIIEYPQANPAGYNRHEIISAIRIYNQFLDGNSARAEVLKGGVGYQYVKIQLQSRWNKGFQYLVQIYGH